MKLIVLAFLAGCNKTPPDQPAPDPEPTAEPQPAPAPVEEPVPADVPDTPAREEPADPAPSPDPGGRYGASYTVTEGPTLEGTTLAMLATHGGGCKDHVFSPRLDPRSEDAPSTQVVHVHHENNGDTCRAMVRTEVSIDLADLLEDCTEAVEVHAWPVDGDHVWTLEMKPPYGCD